MPETSAIVQDADDSVEPDERPESPPPANMISVDQLAAHPGNVRTDLDLSAEFCASIAETGVRIPLLVSHAEGDGGYRVIEGHRVDPQVVEECSHAAAVSGGECLSRGTDRTHLSRTGPARDRPKPSWCPPSPWPGVRSGGAREDVAQCDDGQQADGADHDDRRLDDAAQT